jgi:hypothetical protein
MTGRGPVHTHLIVKVVHFLGARHANGGVFAEIGRQRRCAALLDPYNEEIDAPGHQSGPENPFAISRSSACL